MLCNWKVAQYLKVLLLAILIGTLLLICWEYGHGYDPLSLELRFNLSTLLQLAQPVVSSNVSNHELSAGIVLFAFNSENKKLCMQYLTETNNLCIRLLSKNSNQHVHLNISLFTVERYYKDYIAHPHVPRCTFDQIIFLNQLDSNES
eukprot:501116_1